MEIEILDDELHEFVSSQRLAFVARKGLRGELFFPVPYVLGTKPTLVGYYRFLLGFSQKEFLPQTYTIDSARLRRVIRKPKSRDSESSGPSSMSARI
jgi:hypothetical protein